MDFIQDKKTAPIKTFVPKKALPKLSIELHTMPKPETGHFKKWLVLGLAAFVLIILMVLFLI
jgi:hypothetical protein